MNVRTLLIILIILIIFAGIIFFMDGYNLASENKILQPTDTTQWDIDSNNTKVELNSKGFHFTSLNNVTNTINIIKNNSTHGFDGTTDLVFEFDYKSANQCGLDLVNNEGARIYVDETGAPNTWIHEKWVYDSANQKVTIYIDGAEQEPVDLSNENMSTLGFQIVDWQGDIDMYISNWKAYSG